MIIAPIVEGHGEVEAVPVLIRRLAAEIEAYPRVLPGIRKPKGQLLKQEELQKVVTLAAKKLGSADPICVLLDADDDCPAIVGPRLKSWAVNAVGNCPITVVLASREFEAWFLASAAELAAQGRLRPGTIAPPDPERIRDAKGWLSVAMGRRYSETIDQPAFAATFDLNAARQCRSFVKFASDIVGMLGA